MRGKFLQFNENVLVSLIYFNRKIITSDLTIFQNFPRLLHIIFCGLVIWIWVFRFKIYQNLLLVGTFIFRFYSRNEWTTNFAKKISRNLNEFRRNTRNVFKDPTDLGIQNFPNWWTLLLLSLPKIQWKMSFFTSELTSWYRKFITTYSSISILFFFAFSTLWKLTLL